MPSFAVKDSRQRNGDEPVNEVQKSWLRSLVGVLGYQATDKLDLQREVTHATCGKNWLEHDVLCLFPSGTRLARHDDW